MPSRRAAPAALALTRWLVLLVVLFDLAGSPFHPHRHDLGVDHLLATAAIAASAGDTAVAGVPAAIEPGHSQAALRASSPAQPRPSLDAALSVLPPTLPVPPQQDVLRLDGAPRGPPLPSGLPHARPASRAPPLLA